MPKTHESNKKLVCETIMGWRYRSYNTTGFVMNVKDITKPNRERFESRDWNPQEDPRCWPEIWKAIRKLEIMDDYMTALTNIFLTVYDNTNLNFNDPELIAHSLHWFHTSEPGINWIALIKTIEKLELKKLPFKLKKKPKKKLPKVNIGEIIELADIQGFLKANSKARKK